jgi:hypothetical protein
MTKRHKGHIEGTLIGGQADFNGVFPYVMKRRNESLAYFPLELDVGPLLAYMEEQKAAGNEIKFLDFFTAAIVQLLRERPQLNRFIKGRRTYQRDTVDVSMVAKREFSEDGGETEIVMKFPQEATFEDIRSKLRGEVKTVKNSTKEQEEEDAKVYKAFFSLPRWVFMFAIKILELMDFYKGIPKAIREIDPTRASVFIANLGSIGLDAPYHHLFEWGTCSMFVTIGRIGKKPAVAEDGETVIIKTMVDIKIVYDERITDGYYAARSLDKFKEYFKTPSLVTTPQTSLPSGSL